MDIYNPPIELTSLILKQSGRYRLRWKKGYKFGLPYEVLEAQERHYNPHRWPGWQVTWITVHRIPCNGFPIEELYYGK